MHPNPKTRVLWKYPGVGSDITTNKARENIFYYFRGCYEMYRYQLNKVNQDKSRLQFNTNLRETMFKADCGMTKHDD